MKKPIQIRLAIAFVVLAGLGIFLSLFPIVAWALEQIHVKDDVKYIGLFCVSLILLGIGVYGLIKKLKR